LLLARWATGASRARFLAWRCGLHVIDKSLERHRPELIEPSANDPQAGRIDRINAARSGSPVVDQAGFAQHFQVLRHRWATDRQPLRQLPDRARAGRQPFKDGPSRRICKRRERGSRVGHHVSQFHERGPLRARLTLVLIPLRRRGNGRANKSNL